MPKICFPLNILRIYLFGKMTKYFPLDSIVYGVIGLPINIYSEALLSLVEMYAKGRNFSHAFVY